MEGCEKKVPKGGKRKINVEGEKSFEGDSKKRKFQKKTLFKGEKREPLLLSFLRIPSLFYIKFISLIRRSN